MCLVYAELCYIVTIVNEPYRFKSGHKYSGIEYLTLRQINIYT